MSAAKATKGKETPRVMGLSPFRGFWDMQNEMNRLFNEMLGATTPRGTGQRQLEGLTEWAPAIDVVTKNGDLIVRAELPRVKPEDVDITLHDNVLTISGDRKAEQEVERGGYYLRERRYGSFSRSLTLPQGTDQSKINARYENGVLEVTVEGAAVEQEPSRIEIEGSGS
jgi:HSP20 family protein